ncbi:hypothetical protein SBBP2_250005 [Burkholderiales bacterium]|nr:hypothetical protein SBBP2_250005 [Burkholderiales bacterium]
MYWVLAFMPTVVSCQFTVMVQDTDAPEQVTVPVLVGITACNPRPQQLRSYAAIGAPTQGGAGLVPGVAQLGTPAAVSEASVEAVMALPLTVVLKFAAADAAPCQ